ncbi:MAG: caspase family protein [Candidatus Aminicenantes bacterium]
MSKRRKKGKIIALLPIFAFIACSNSPSSQDLKGTIPIREDYVFHYEKSYALLIGVWDYMKGWGSLSPENIENDLETVAKALNKHDFFTRTVINPTYDEIIEELNQFKNNYGLEKNNRLLFYFSGHGQGRHNNEIGYIVPKDAPFPDTRKNEKEFLKRAVSMEDFITLAKEIESKHVLFIFDSCFSGTIFRARRGPPSQSNPETRDLPVRLCITAGRAQQQVPGKSVFTPAFVRGINGEADFTGNGEITGGELFEYIKNEVSESRSNQVPQMGTIKVPGCEDEGDFLFILNQSRQSHKNPGKTTTDQKPPEYVNLLIRIYPYADVYINGEKLGEIPPQKVIEKIREHSIYTIKLISDDKEYNGKFVIKNGQIRWIKPIFEITVKLEVKR